jgi:predicted kinase
MEMAWHDCYGEVAPSDDVVDDVLLCSEGTLDGLVNAAHLAVVDRRDLGGLGAVPQGTLLNAGPADGRCPRAVSIVQRSVEMLIVFGGLPGVGKTALARAVAERLTATYLRVDAVEAALWQAGVARDQPTGLAAYVVAHTVAEGSLAVGAPVVIDAVNPVEAARRGWRDLAHRLVQPLRVIEVVCLDATEHRRRVESRTADLEGHTVPTWRDVRDREYEPWDEPRLTVDTAAESPTECLARVLDYVAG